MPARGRAMSPEEFHDRLRRGALAPAASVTGMVRTSDRDGSFQLSVDSCQTWVDVPLASLEEVEVLGRRSCGDHSHPLVRIGLAEPGESDPWERHLLVRTLAFADRFGGLLGGERTTTRATTDGGTGANPCRDCVRGCFQLVGDAEAFRDCITRCPC